MLTIRKRKAILKENKELERDIKKLLTESEIKNNITIKDINNLSSYKMKYGNTERGNLKVTNTKSEFNEIMNSVINYVLYNGDYINNVEDCDAEVYLQEYNKIVSEIKKDDESKLKFFNAFFTLESKNGKPYFVEKYNHSNREDIERNFMELFPLFLYTAGLISEDDDYLDMINNFDLVSSVDINKDNFLEIIYDNVGSKTKSEISKEKHSDEITVYFDIIYSDDIDVYDIITEDETYGSDEYGFYYVENIEVNINDDYIITGRAVLPTNININEDEKIHKYLEKMISNSELNILDDIEIVIWEISK